MDRLASEVSVLVLDVAIALGGELPADVAAISFAITEGGKYVTGMEDFVRRIREDDFKPAQVYR